MRKNCRPLNVLKHQLRLPQESRGQPYQGPFFVRKEIMYQGVYHIKTGHVYPELFFQLHLSLKEILHFHRKMFLTMLLQLFNTIPRSYFMSK